MRYPSAKSVWPALVATAFLLLACGKEGISIDPVEPGPYLMSPADVMENVEKSFEERKLERLDEVIGPDFVFHFDADDVGLTVPFGSYVIPRTWGRDDFMATAGNLFGRAYAVELYVSTSSIGEPARGAWEYRAEDVMVRFVVMTDMYNGYVSNPGYCDFAFDKYYNNEGELRWHLADWWDKTNEVEDEFSGGALPSFGRVLAMYH